VKRRMHEHRQLLLLYFAFLDWCDREVVGVFVHFVRRFSQDRRDPYQCFGAKMYALGIL
jgi:hypothetical protein